MARVMRSIPASGSLNHTFTKPLEPRQRKVWVKHQRLVDERGPIIKVANDVGKRHPG
jgi:hypothetical protein